MVLLTALVNARTVSRGHREPTRCRVILKADVLYFALGLRRASWLEPFAHSGSLSCPPRRHEDGSTVLMEAPIMLVATIVAARWTVLAVPPMPSADLEWVASDLSSCSLRIWFRALRSRHFNQRLSR